MKRLFLLAAILTALSIPNTASAVADLSQTHDPLLLVVGAPSWNYDTGWLSAGLGSIGSVAVRLWVGLGGTVLDVDLNGAGKLTYPTGPNKGNLWFQGSTGSVAQDLGFEMHGQYKVTVAGTDYTGDLPYVPNTDIRLKDSETPTPYMLGQSVTLSDTISNQNLYVYHIGFSGIFTGDIGVSVSAADQVKIDFKRLNTDKAVFTVENERKEVTVTGPTLTVGDIYEMLGITPTMTFTPNIVVGITVLGIPFNVTIPTFPINIPLASLLQPEYPTTPPRSITFQIPPTVAMFVINNAAAYTFSHAVLLNNDGTNTPLEYLASEDSGFSGAAWLTYNAGPSFTLSGGDGTKQVYFKVRNAGGESEVVSDTILVNTVLPTVASRITNDMTPSLSGTVAIAGCPVSVTVGTQTVSAVNHGDGTWTLADNVLSALAQGTYNVIVTVTDPVGNTLTDATSNELVIDLTAPTVTVNTLVTGDTTPSLSGTINDPTAAISITVGVQTRTATNNGNGTWTLADNSLSALVQGTYNVQVTATDTAENVGHDSTTNELTIDTSLPVVTVNTLITSDTTPALSGMINEATATISVTVGGQTRTATNNGNGTWTLADNSLTALTQGVYNVQVAAEDVSHNVGHDSTTNELTIDTTPPTVTVNTLVTNDPTPRLTGTVADLTATTIELLVGSQTRTATNNGDGTWTLADNVLATLADNVYDVQITATDAAGNIGHDATTSELTVDTVAPTVGVYTKITNDTTPELSGTVNDPTAAISITVGSQTRTADNLRNGSWLLSDNILSALVQGTYNVQVTATDAAGNVGHDSTTGELVIDRTAPTATITLLGPSPTSADSVAFRVTFSEPVASFTSVARTGTLASVSTSTITGSSPVYTVTVTLNNPDTNGDIGIRIYGGVVTDIAGNGYAGGVSGLYSIVNWCGFTVEPHDARVYVGDWQTFTAGAGCGGSALTYQWKWRDAAMAEHDGPTGPQWLLSGVSEASRGDYWCEISYEGVPHATASAKLEVEPRLVIETPPEGADKTVGESYTFSVVATGGYPVLHYQWQHNGTPIPDATDTSYTIPALLVDHAGSYTVAVTDDNETTVTSEPATLNVSLGLPLAAGGVLAALACVFVVVVARRLRTQAEED